MDSKIVVLGATAAALIAAVTLIVEIRRPNAAEKERRRRKRVNRNGRMSDCTVVDWDGDLLQYDYHVHGVSYSATQDVSTLHQFLPAEPGTFVGPAYVKYDPHIPSNSIVVCEDWSGLRLSRPAHIPTAHADPPDHENQEG